MVPHLVLSKKISAKDNLTKDFHRPPLRLIEKDWDNFADLAEMVTYQSKPSPLIGPNRPKRDGQLRADLGIPRS